MKRLLINNNGLKIYMAGLPDYPRNFSRDGLLSAILTKNIGILHDQLLFCIKKQGKEKNSYTGEEPGKIFHEYPGYIIDNLSTEYNACDTTALFIIGFYEYYKQTNKREFVELNKESIENATRYILNHIRNGFFIEDPSFCDAKRFALKSTYWKDAQAVSKNNNKIEYPVIYPIVHIQNMHALRCAAKLLKNNELNKTAKNMQKKIKELFDKKGSLFLAIDKKGPIEAVNSDTLQSLFYLDKEDLTKEQLDKISDCSDKIQTNAGYVVLEKEFPFKLKKNSFDFTKSVWPFEQAFIHAGAKKFGLTEIMGVSKRVIKYLKTEPEYIIIKNSEIIESGSNPQLWTIAAKKYFKKEIQHQN